MNCTIRRNENHMLQFFQLVAVNCFQLHHLCLQERVEWALPPQELCKTRVKDKQEDGGMKQNQVLIPFGKSRSKNVQENWIVHSFGLLWVMILQERFHFVLNLSSLVESESDSTIDHQNDRRWSKGSIEGSGHGLTVH